MANIPQKSKDATEEALSAVQEALNVRPPETPPVASTTCPLMVPLDVCAQPARLKAINMFTNANSLAKNFMLGTPSIEPSFTSSPW